MRYLCLEIACYANYPIKRRTEGGALMILVSFVIPHRRQKAMEGDCATSASGTRSREDVETLS